MHDAGYTKLPYVKKDHSNKNCFSMFPSCYKTTLLENQSGRKRGVVDLV